MSKINPKYLAKNSCGEMGILISEHFDVLLSVFKLKTGKSESDFAADLDVTRQTINNWKNGKSEITKTQFLAIMEILKYYGIAPEDIKAIIEVIVGKES